MKTKTIAVSRIITAPRSMVYNFLADYVNHHSKILPRKYFDGIAIEQGGYGEGTHLRYDVKAYGARHTFHSVVHEPEPGYTMLELEVESGAYTVYSVQDLGERGSKVTISARPQTGEGLLSAIESVLVRRLLQNVFAERLRLLEKALSSPATRPAAVPRPAVIAAAISNNDWLKQGIRHLRPAPWVLQQPAIATSESFRVEATA